MSIDSKQPKNTSPEKLGLQGQLQTFEGTPIMPLIQKALEEAGIDPRAYKPEEQGHATYRGLLVDTIDRQDHPGWTEISPIIQAIEDGIKNGTIVVTRADYSKIEFHPWSMEANQGMAAIETPNAMATSKLSVIGMLELRDADSGQILAYAPSLHTDGGRSGRALISVNDVIERQ